MADILYINNTVIDPDYIIEYPSIKQELTFEECSISPEISTFTLDNTDPTIFDDRYPGSMFNTTTGIGLIVKWYDDVINKYTFIGKITNMETDDEKIKVEVTSYLADLAEIDCIYTNASNKTPAKIIYEILTDVAGFSPDDIVYSGFNEAINLQTTHSCYANVTIADDDSSGDPNYDSCMTVINNLLKYSNCHLYTKQNLIYLWSYKKYAGEVGASVNTILPKSYKQWYSNLTGEYKVYNKYKIAYDNSGTIAWVTGSDATSIEKYGEKRFVLPEDSEDSTASADYGVLLRNSTGATWVGANTIERFGNILKFCEFTVDGSYIHVDIGDTINLRFKPFYGEPVLVMNREYVRKDDTIKLKCLFLNTPTVVYSRDSTPPDTLELVRVTYDEDTNSIKIEWAKSLASDHMGYRIYFTTTKGAWEGEECNLGRSPIDVRPTALNGNGCVEQIITKINSYIPYYFYITDVDTSLNESDPSNVLSTSFNTPTSPIEDYITGNEPIPESEYTEYLEDTSYLPWILEQNYTQWILGAQGPQGEKGDKGEKGDAGNLVTAGILQSDVDTAPQLTVKSLNGTVLGMFEHGTSSGMPTSFSGIHSDTNFGSGRLFNALFMDVAEQLESDGTLKPGDLAYLDISFDGFRVTNVGNQDSFIGVYSEKPGFIVGCNPSYKYPVEIALKGTVWVNTGTHSFKKGKKLYMTPSGKLSQVNSSKSHFLGTVVEIKDTSLRIFI